jgi:hypothetical protein
MRRKPAPDFEEDLFEGLDESLLEDLDDTIKPLSKAKLKKMTLLDRLENLIQLAENCGLSTDFFQLHKNLIQSVAHDLALTPEQAVLLCPYIADPGSIVDQGDLRHFFNCSAISIMRKKNDLKALLHRRYVAACGGGFRRGRDGNYCLTEKAQKALCDNRGLPVLKTTGLSAAEFMNMFRSLLNEAFHLQQIDTEELLLETMQLLDDNPELEIVKAINSLKLYDTDKYVILSFCKLLVIDGEEGVPLNHFDDEIENYYDFSEAMLRGYHPFIKLGLLELMKRDSLFQRDVFTLTEKARSMFLSEFVIPKRKVKEQSFDNATLIHCKSITPKILYYSAEDQGQIDTLKGLLEEKQLKAIRKRLENANMRKGFNCLFYGSPGTGKTETTLQLARLTGRDIMQVDISSIRDKYYGETEKAVRQIFNDYAQFVKKSKRIPILLINEADALLSVRTGIGTNASIDKTENAIQNILLEAMESIDGIMIATTNLTCNLDSAFDRRFLYKVEFHQPSIEAKTNIWKSFLPELNLPDAKKLACSFDFSGGQIENIARKAMVDHLLFGSKPNLERIMELCSNEKISGRTTERKPIGFH